MHGKEWRAIHSQLTPNTSVKAKGREELAAQKKAPHNEKMFDDVRRDVATEHDSIEQLQRLKANLTATLRDKGAELASLKDKGRESKSLRRRKRRSTMKSCAAIASTTPGSRNEAGLARPPYQIPYVTTPPGSL